MIRCQICQHENPEGAEYCEDCGASLSTSAVPSTPPGTANPVAGAPEPSTLPPAAESLPQESAPAAPVEASVTPGDAPAPEGIGTSVPDSAAPIPDPLPAFEPVPAIPAPPPAPATGQQPRLVGRRFGADSGEVYPLLGERLVVGRFDPESGPVDVDLSQAPEAGNISRHHAEVYREPDGRWYVKDLGAVNGVFIKSTGSASFGPRLTAPQALQNGDEVAFANARFIFRTD